MGRKEKDYNCPVEATLFAIGGKWKGVILWHLKDKPCRFGRIRKLIPDITQKMLTQQLREMEEDGLVHREIFPQVPPRVEYSLTDYGRTLRPLLNQMCRWGVDHLRYMDNESPRQVARS